MAEELLTPDLRAALMRHPIPRDKLHQMLLEAARKNAGSYSKQAALASIEKEIHGWATVGLDALALNNYPDGHAIAMLAASKIGKLLIAKAFFGQKGLMH